MTKTDHLKILILDIETAPILAYVWGLFDQNIGLNQIHTDRYVMAWGAKWLGSKEVFYMDKRNTPPGDDKAILIPLWELLNEADIVITQNGIRFDSKRLNARFIYHKMKPPKPYRHYDTLQLVKRVADFTSNKLEYLTDKLNKKHKKTLHNDYPGFYLWKACLEGVKAAWNAMKKYNIADVLSTEELYFQLRNWSPESFPHVFPFADGASQCGTCGYHGKMREGALRHAQLYDYRQHSCPKCGAWQKGARIARKKGGK